MLNRNQAPKEYVPDILYPLESACWSCGQMRQGNPTTPTRRCDECDVGWTVEFLQSRDEQDRVREWLRQQRELVDGSLRKFTEALAERARGA